jgi:PIN domain nuclease of toxin-antitoxin system
LSHVDQLDHIVSGGGTRPAAPGRAVPELIAADDFTDLPVTLTHTERLAGLASHHTDPFDRMLLSQALAERATIVSHDGALEPYGVSMIWT